MSLGLFNVPTPSNEPVRSYAPESPERASIKQVLRRQASEEIEVPLWIGGECVRTGRTVAITMPHDHGHKLGEYHRASAADVERAIAAAETAKPGWAGWTAVPTACA